MNNYMKLKNYVELTKIMVNQYYKMKTEFNNTTKEYIQKITQLSTNYSQIISNYKTKLEFSGGEMNELLQLLEKIKSILISHSDKLQSFIKESQEEENKNKINQEILSNFEKISNDFLQKEKKMSKAYADFENCAKNLRNSYKNVENTLAINILSKDNRKISINENVNQEFKSIIDKEKNLDKAKKDVLQNKNEFFKSYDELIKIAKIICSENIHILIYNINCFITLFNHYYKTFSKYLDPIIKDIKNSEAKMDYSKITDSLIDVVNIDINIGGYKIRVIKNRYIEDKNKKLNIDKLNKKGYIINNNKIILKDEDIYEIVKIMYAQFQFIDENSYNLIEEQIKLKVKNLTKKILSFDEKISIFDKIGVEPINESELKLLFTYFNKSFNRLEFLKALNLFRAKGIYKIPEKEFEILKKIFILISDKITIENDIACAKLVLILSQTFYCKIDGKDIYLQHYLKNHDMIFKLEIWEKYINEMIEEEFNKTERIEKKVNIKSSEQNTKYIITNVLSSQLIPFSDNMYEFGMSVENIYKIINPIMDKYQVKNELKDTIDDIIKSKQNESV